MSDFEQSDAHTALALLGSDWPIDQLEQRDGRAETTVCHSNMEIELQMVFAVAWEVKLRLSTVMYKLYNGCYYNYSSQVQHKCLMLDDEERIRLCVETALDMVDWNKSQDWQEDLTIAEQIRCPLQCNDFNWFRHVFRDMDMKEKLIAVLWNQSECVDSGADEVKPMDIDKTEAMEVDDVVC